MELSGISFSVERAGLNIGYRLIELRLNLVQPVCVIGKSVKVLLVTLGSWSCFISCVGEESICQSFRAG